MDKLNMQTSNRADENYQKLVTLFPNAVTETVDEEGNLVRAIDKDVLMQEIHAQVVDGPQERYQFTWPDKRKSVVLANQPIAKTLRLEPEKSVSRSGIPGGGIDSENIYIEGDNLDALKLLQETYLGKVKMIYIDPPYNTGHNFIYQDDFSQNIADYAENSGQTDDEGNRLVKNLESNGRFHTDWLNMMYPRLRLAKDLLSEDGVIFLSIDENESANLRKMCDEVFGNNNFVSDIIWQSRTSISNDYEVSMNHNQTLIYSKNRANLVFGGDEIDAEEYINPDDDPRGSWKLVPLDANHAGGDTVYPVKNPKTGVEYYPPNGRIWCYGRQTMAQLLQEGRIKFGLNDDSAPKRKLYLNERVSKGDVKTPSSLLLDAGTTKDGTKEIMALFNNEKVFDYPKSVEFIDRLLQYGAPHGGMILDFFSGSGTTAHAVLNKGSKTTNIYKFIMIQIPEDLNESLKTAPSSAKKTIQNAIRVLDLLKQDKTVASIGEERIRRASKKIKEETGADIDYGFRCFRVDSSNMKDVYYQPAELEQNFLDSQIDNVKEDRTPEDLLIQVMLDLGVLLSSKIESKEIVGKKVFSVADGYLIACFDRDVTEEVVTQIAKEQPFYAVFRDSSMANDSVAANFDQIFQTYSPQTVRKVL